MLLHPKMSVVELLVETPLSLLLAAPAPARAGLPAKLELAYTTLAPHYAAVLPGAWPRPGRQKCGERSGRCRVAGNAHYSRGEASAAVERYSEAASLAEPGSQELGLALGNRAAALLELARPRAALQDITAALDCPAHPASLRYKLHMRAGLARRALGQPVQATAELQTALAFLGGSGLDKEREREVREAITRAAEGLLHEEQPEMIENLKTFVLNKEEVEAKEVKVEKETTELKMTNERRLKAELETMNHVDDNMILIEGGAVDTAEVKAEAEEAGVESELAMPELETEHPEMAGLADCLRVEWSEEKGRHLVAAGDILPGQLVAVEHAAVGAIEIILLYNVYIGVATAAPAPACHQPLLAVSGLLPRPAALLHLLHRRLLQ